MSDSLSDESIGLVRFLLWETPMAFAFYRHHGEKQTLIELLHDLAEPRQVIMAATASEALAAVRNGDLVVLSPDEETAAVSYLNHNREHFQGARGQLLTVLLRDGAGSMALRDSPAIASYARAGSFDTSTQPTHAEAELAFQNEYGLPFREWLEQWRCGALPDTLANNLILSQAIALELPP